MNQAPMPTGKPPASVSIAGALFAMDRGETVLLRMPGSEYTYLPVFSAEAKLRALMDAVGIGFDRIKRIDDPDDFLASVRGFFVVILDPTFTPEGRVRFIHIAEPA